MVIPDRDVGGTGFGPAEDDAPLVVDADGMAVLAVSQQGVKAVGWWEAQSFKGRRGGKFAEFAQCPILNIGWQLA